MASEMKDKGDASLEGSTGTASVNDDKARLAEQDTNGRSDTRLFIFNSKTGEVSVASVQQHSQQTYLPY
jgi:hypothetical protein